MVLKCLGSSSAGNCYLLQGNDETLVIEAGVPMMEVKKALGFNIRVIKGCVVSHEHKDHAGFIKEYVKSGIRVLALPEVFSRKFVRGHFCKTIEPMKGYKVGGFKILTLSAAHDVPCLSFIIEHGEMGKLAFITDTMMMEYRLPRLDHIMLEANYADDLLQGNIDAGIVPASMRERLLHSHMELRTAKNILLANDRSSLRDVVLIHLSANNSDEERFRREVQELTGLPVYVAKKGFEIELGKLPY